MKQLNKLRRWEHDDSFHLLYLLVILIVHLKKIKNYYIIYIEDEERQKPKIVLQLFLGGLRRDKAQGKMDDDAIRIRKRKGKRRSH